MMTETTSNPPSLRALVVDDEPAVRLALECAMQDEGWDVRVASSARDALETLQEWTPDVVLADKNMPDTNGIELLRQVRRRSQSVAFVLMTGFSSLDSLKEATHLDIDGYLEKPFRNVYAMLASVRRYVARRTSRTRFREAREHFQKAAQLDQAHDGGSAVPAIAVVLQDSADRGRVQWALDPIYSGNTAYPALEGQSHDVAVTICDAASLPAARKTYPHAFLVALADASDLKGSLQLIDSGANFVIDPAAPAETIRLSIERAVRLAAPLEQSRRMVG